MTITTTQKIIKIGSSRGVTLPAKQLLELNVKEGDEVEIVVRKKTIQAKSGDVTAIATSLLDRYKQDFTNLKNR